VRSPTHARLWSLLAFVATPLFTACRPSQPKYARLQGDVYLVMKSGDVKRGAGNVVHLLADRETLSQDMSRVCETELRHLLSVRHRSGPASEHHLMMPVDPSQVTDSALLIRLVSRAAMEAVLTGATMATSPTGVEGHYQFDSLRAGRYVLWATTDIGAHHYTWWAGILVAAGDSLRHDLDNASEADARINCDAYVDSALTVDSIAQAAVERDREISLQRVRDSVERVRERASPSLRWLVCAVRHSGGATGPSDLTSVLADCGPIPWPVEKDHDYVFLDSLLNGMPNPGMENFVVLVVEPTRAAMQ
jgi:hypothetical protein